MSTLGNWKPAVKDILSKHFLLGALDESILDELLDRSRLRRYERGEALFYKGDPGDSLLAILMGKVRISTLSAQGQEIVLNVLGPGEIFGEIAFLDGKDRTADAAAMEPTTLVALERRSFLPFIETHLTCATPSSSP